MGGRYMDWIIKRGYPYPLGVTRLKEGIQIAISLPNETQCNIYFYKQGEQKVAFQIKITEEYMIGTIFSVIIKPFDIEQYEYLLEVNGKKFLDPYAKRIIGRKRFGKPTKQVRSAYLSASFNWEEDKNPYIPYPEMILYRLHVRGFTKHISSNVTYRGTFKGVEEKIPYLKELGINAIELMPIYEFNEVMQEGIRETIDQRFIKENETQQPIRINYWGYAKECNYFAPKSSYSSDPLHPDIELKQLIKSLHQNKIEAIMEFCFPQGMNTHEILECIRYWILEYHIDGVRMNDSVTPSHIIATDPSLTKTKFFSTNWNLGIIYPKDFVPNFCNLAEYNDGFLIAARKYLKGDEGQVNAFLHYFKHNPAKMGTINYITNTNSFTLMDLVSYDIKHNEANKEEGRDGTEFNYSWNCGVEGRSKKKAVIALRKKQIKNAFMMLLLSQGTPLLLAGDEFLNSQEGNNNPYCQDNKVSWLNWNLIQTNQDIFQFVKRLVQIRKEHDIFHMSEELKIMDYMACGYPDISFHGTKSWYPDFSNYSRVLGIMLCGSYTAIQEKKPDHYFYLAFNMHWEAHEYELPKLPDGTNWKVFIDTAQEKEEETKESMISEKTYIVKPRSIVVFIGIKQLEIKKKQRKSHRYKS